MYDQRKKSQNIFAALALLVFYDAAERLRRIGGCRADNGTCRLRRRQKRYGPGNRRAGNTGSPLELALQGKYKGTKVTMFGPFVDVDQKKFEESIKDFEDKT